MLVPNRHEASESYRYGFQNQEKDDELKGEGNSINYTYRMHDPRVGRFFASDPIESDFPWNSPYAFSENNVIHAIEFEGLEKIALSGAAPPFQYKKPEGLGGTAYVSKHVDFFAKQATRLNKKYGYHTAQVLTGKDFINSLVNETKKYGSISSIAIFSHGGSDGLYLSRDEGFYSTEANRRPGLGAATIQDLQKKIKNGEIKFDKDAVCFFDACHAAGIGVNVYSETPARELTLITGITTIASTGSVSMKDTTNTNGEFVTDGIFYKFTKVQYQKEVQVKNPEKTSAWQFWKSNTITKKVKDYTVKKEKLGNEVKMDDYIKK